MAYTRTRYLVTVRWAFGPVHVASFTSEHDAQRHAAKMRNVGLVLSVDVTRA